MALYVTSSNVSSLTIHDVARTETGQLATLTFQRVHLPPDLVVPIVYGCRCKQVPCICERPTREVPPRLVTQTPPPAVKLHLDLSLGDFIGVQNSGVICATSLADTQTVTGAQFALKFSGHYRNKNLLREAWFYDELQSLQGATVPRSYGYFYAMLPANWTVVPWQGHKHNDAELADEVFNPLGGFNMSYRPVSALFETGHCLGVLLLERMGEAFLEAGSGEPMPDGVIKNIYKAYEDLGFLGVEHGSVHSSNIRRVMHNAANQPSLASPFSNLTQDFRLVDFESARKTNGTLLATGLTHAAVLEVMLDEPQR